MQARSCHYWVIMILAQQGASGDPNEHLRNYAFTFIYVLLKRLCYVIISSIQPFFEQEALRMPYTHTGQSPIRLLSISPSSIEVFNPGLLVRLTSIYKHSSKFALRNEY